MSSEKKIIKKFVEVNFVRRNFFIIFGRPFVKRFALYRPMLLDRCLSVLSVTLMYCGQTVGRIKMKLGM